MKTWLSPLKVLSVLLIILSLVFAGIAWNESDNDSSAFGWILFEILLALAVLYFIIAVLLRYLLKDLKRVFIAEIVVIIISILLVLIMVNMS